MVEIPSFDVLVIIFGLVASAAAYFTRQGLSVRRLKKETKNQAEVLKIIAMYVAETMDKEKGLKFIEKIFIDRGRWG